MPKPLTPEQLGTLQSNGVVIPGLEAAAGMPAGLLVRTLGGVGLPHSEGRLDPLPDDLPVPSAAVSLEHLADFSLEQSYRTAHNLVCQIMGVVGEVMPAIDDTRLIARLEHIKPLFAKFEVHGLEPEVVVSPFHRPLSFWESVAEKLQDSSLNPTHSSGSGKVLQNGGLQVADGIKDSWDDLTASAVPAWDVSVISGKPSPEIVNITSFGYVDARNTKPSGAALQLIQDLGLPTTILHRTSWATRKLAIVQPDIHPDLEAYIMHQFNRIVNSGTPVDSSGYSWLNGVLKKGHVPVGGWYPVDGQVHLYWDVPNGGGDNVGVRPAGRSRA